MNILVINCGSSSIKYRLFAIDDNKDADELANGLIERIGSSEASVHHQVGREKFARTGPIKDYRTGIADIADHLRAAQIIDDDLAAIGHRVVHGGEAFRDSVIITEAVIQQIDRCCTLAPLHNPANLAGIRACAGIFPNVPQIAVFDTAFFHTLDPSAYMYALPYHWYDRYQVRRYGFHGTSHRYVAQRAAELLAKPLDDCSLITMHLGNGCSMTAVRDGLAVNTTMGLTPLEGLVMGTRCGDIDTAILFHMLAVTDMTVADIRDALEKNSGLWGLSGVSGDMRDVFEAADAGNDRAKLALAVFARRVRKYLGAYLTETGRCDAMVFTGGIGENSHRMREMVTADLEHLGIILDRGKNATAGPPAAGTAIHDPAGEIAIFVIATNEELAIARDSFVLISDRVGKRVTG